MTGSRTSRAPYVVVLTGGIASGKTAVSAIFQGLGVPVIDTDVIARELVQPGQTTLEAVAREFGEKYLLPDGNLNRSKVRELIFSNPSAKTKLENILHPAILSEVKTRIADVSTPYCILVVPLFVESTKYEWVDRVLVIDADRGTQKSRVMERDGMDGAHADAIISAQASRHQRLALADDVIENSGSISDLEPQVIELHEHYMSLARRDQT